MHLTQLVNKYDNFILDVWGVLHDGADAIPGATKFIKHLQENNKKFCILSNAPRPRETVYSKLVKLGFDFDKNLVITSGDFFLSRLKDFLGDNIYVLGEELNTDLLKGIEIKRTKSLDDAKYLLMLFYADTDQEVLSQQKILEEAVQKNVIMICSNPDITVQQGKSLRYTQGTFAKLYEDLGGDVMYFGKPHHEIYEYVFNQYGFNKSNTLMIGDSLATDIRGAANYNFDSLLVLTGIHNGENDLDGLYTQYNCTPTYVLDNLEL